MFAGEDRNLFDAAMARFDAENAQDPNEVEIGGEKIPYELFYARKVTGWVLRLCPSASEALRLAARSQHICRWAIPRHSYPEGREGYLQWRAELKRFHAAKSGEILAALGFPAEIIERVQALNLKKNLKHDPEVQILEDALCLVTLECQLADLVRKTPEDKMISILRKTWAKMSPAARGAALQISYAPDVLAIVQQALSGSDPV